MMIRCHTQLMLDDMRALMQAWECCTWWKENRADRVLNQVVPSGPRGLCGRGRLGFVRLNRCLCPGVLMRVTLNQDGVRELLSSSQGPVAGRWHP